MSAASHRADADRVAATLLSAHGEDTRGAVRGRGWTNATWLGTAVVARVSRVPGADDLLREARLVEQLPTEIGHPRVLATGVEDGHAWVLTRRVDAVSLDAVWPTLDDAERARAVEQLWERAGWLHRTDTAAVAPHVRRRSPFFAQTPDEAARSVEVLTAAGALTRDDAAGLGQVLDRYWLALPTARAVLVHGDLCPLNALWRDGEVVGLLDLEFALLAPAAVDLNELAKAAFAPARRAGDLERRAVARIARTSLSEAGGEDVLLGYAALLELWTLGRVLAEGPDGDEDDRAVATEVLHGLARGDGGCYRPLLSWRRVWRVRSRGV